MRLIIILAGTIMVAMGLTCYGIYTTWIFVVSFTKYRLYMRFIILLAGTIMVAMGLNCYHGIYTTWIFVVSFPKYMFIYEFIILLAPLWLQWDCFPIIAYTQHGLRCGTKRSGLRMRLLSLMTFTQHGFRCGFANRKCSPLRFNLFIMG
jgi:hypothetical protein